MSKTKWQFYIFLLAFLLCNSVFAQKHSKKNSAPPPTIDSVSVDPVSGMAVMAWTQISSADVDSFYFYEYLPENSPQWSNFFKISGDSSKTAFFVQIPIKDPSASSITLNLAAVTTGQAPAWSLKEHRTIYLTSKYSNCQLQTLLSWNKYINWNGGVKEYQVLVSENSSPFKVLATLSKNDTSFVHSGLNAQFKYEYVIRAFENGTARSSSSNKRMVIAEFPSQPSFNYLANVSVINNNQIELFCKIDTSAEIEYYSIFRKEENTAYKLIKQVQRNSILNQDFFKLIDSQVDAKSRSYSYLVKAINKCGKIAISSEISNSILLTGENNPENLVNSLSWNSFVNWQGKVSHYNIYRSINGIYPTNPLATITPENLSFDEILENFTHTNGQFCYRIEAVEGPSIYKPQKSYSNEICLVQQPLIFTPNSFNPNGVNKVFLPVISFVETKNYSLSICDRWGNVIFQSFQIEEGWDGKIAGQIAPAGLYIYQINYTTALGTIQGKTGMLQLLQ